MDTAVEASARKDSAFKNVHMTIPKETLDRLRKEADRRKIGYSTLASQIMLDWLDAQEAGAKRRRAKSEAA